MILADNPASRERPIRPRVLIIDDDLSMRILVRAALESNGFEVAEADNGHAGLASYDTQRPDLVLLDVIMPDLDGYKTCTRLRGLSGGETTPIVMMTGLDDIESIERAYEVGATDFTTKPINGTLLVHRLRYLLRASNDARTAKETAYRLAQAQRLARLVRWEYCPTTNRFRWSEEASEILGVQTQEGGDINELLRWVHPDDRDNVLGELATDSRGEIEYRLVLDGGVERTIHQEVDRVEDPETGQRRLVGVAQDVTERRRAEEKAAHLAFYDSLTGLPNRALLSNYLNEALGNAQRHGHPMAVLAIDLDLFKRVNDMYGHAAGDALLVESARRIAGCLRSGDTTFVPASQGDKAGFSGESLAARLGGDEFIAVLPRLRTAEDAAPAAQRILDQLSNAFTVENTDLLVSASIGIAVYPENGTDPDSLCRSADAAMYHAKEQGRNNFQFFTPSMHERSQRRAEIEAGLRVALADLATDPQRSASGLYIHYQPKIAVGTNELVGVEALARWHSPTLGAVTPAEFIPVAEDSGLILPLGEWIIRTACETVRNVTASSRLPLAVNISARQFCEPGFVSQLASILHDANFDPQQLELELTEGVIMQDTQQSHQVLDELKRLGVRVAIDDFGTGYSSLSYLTRFPFDTVKIDQSFIKLIGSERNDAIVAAIIALSHNLGLDVVAEGVEEESQLDFLSTFGQLDIQGYYFAKPMNAADLPIWIDNH